MVDALPRITSVHVLNLGPEQVKVRIVQFLGGGYGSLKRLRSRTVILIDELLKLNKELLLFCRAVTLPAVVLIFNLTVPQ